MQTTKIEWTESTWNPSTGCTKISTGCKHCYAERMAKRLKAMGLKKYQNGFDFAFHPECLEEPKTWKNPRTVFVNSMSDLFHEKMSFENVEKVFKVMNDNLMHTFQVLTKRSDIMLDYAKSLDWTKNIWLGVTVESGEFLNRIDDLRKTGALVKFISFEPLLDSVGEINLSGIDWVIVGGESGPGARPIEESWVLEIQSICQMQDIPFFFKQWGGVNKKKNGRELRGKKFSEMPPMMVS
jgi:protein gp37